MYAETRDFVTTHRFGRPTDDGGRSGALDGEDIEDTGGTGGTEDGSDGDR
jgi:hypothetical protein